MARTTSPVFVYLCSHKESYFQILSFFFRVNILLAHMTFLFAYNNILNKCIIHVLPVSLHCSHFSKIPSRRSRQGRHGSDHTNPIRAPQSPPSPAPPPEEAAGRSPRGRRRRQGVSSQLPRSLGGWPRRESAVHCPCFGSPLAVAGPAGSSLATAELGVRQQAGRAVACSGGVGRRRCLMSTHASILVDSVGPPSAEVCRTAASFP
jgi:hypothetical protein